MDLVYECFVKLGLRYICVLRDGQYAGLVSADIPYGSLDTGLISSQIHKKSFVKYIKELEDA